MCGAVLTEPTSPGSHAGILFMRAGGYAPMSGHGIIAAATIALERGLVMPAGNGSTLIFDTVAGIVRATAETATRADGSRAVRAVAVENVPSFVLRAGIPIELGARRLRADVAYGGALYAIVDSEAAGVGVDPRNAVELRRAGVAIARAADAALHAARGEPAPVDPVFGTIFTGPPTAAGADIRSVTVFGDGQIERSPGGTGTAALLAVITAMGLSPEDAPFVHEGVAGTVFRACIRRHTVVNNLEAIVCEFSGSAWITGNHQFTIADDDPLRGGLRL
jgi:trans-L-3-hydroxyproline dehydratase